MAVLVLTGCSGGTVRNSSGSSEVFPYSVGVFLKASAAKDPDEAEATLGRICAALASDDALVSRALALSSKTTSAALREGRNLDFLVGVSLETEEVLPEPQVSPGDAALEVATWLVGGLPSWFVATHEYPLAGGMEFEVIDLNDQKVRAWLKLSAESPVPTPAYQLRSSGGSRFLSLVDRSPGDGAMNNYLQSIVMPPMYIPGESAAVINVLNEEAAAGFLEELKGELRGHLDQDEKERPLRIVFSDRSDPSAFSFELLSADGRPDHSLRILDLHRLAEGAERYRWVLRGDELVRVNQELEVKGRARIELADGLPVVAGRNLVKVRALGTDGTRISRTVVIIAD
jgi:hypothetical protein